MRAIAALLLATAPFAAAPPAEALPTSVLRIAAAAHAQGTVTDAKTGRPLGGVFVQQEGALTSAFTDADGQFAVTLDPGQPSRLALTSNGYEARTIDVGDGKSLQIALQPLTTLVPQSAPVPVATETDLEDRPIKPLDSRVSLSYRLRYETITSGTNASTLAGLSDNDYRVALRYRWSKFLIDGELMHVQSPVDVSTLSRDLNPAFDPSTWELGARAGYLVVLKGGWESAFGLAYRYKDTVPNNHGIPFVGNGADFEQSRQAGGVTATVGWNTPRNPWGFEASAQLYPLVYAWAKDPGVAYGNQYGVEANAGVTYEIAHGLRFGLDYKFEDWQGSGGGDVVHLLSAQLHYTPVGIFKGSDR